MRHMPIVRRQAPGPQRANSTRRPARPQTTAPVPPHTTPTLRPGLHQSRLLCYTRPPILFAPGAPAVPSDCDCVSFSRPLAFFPSGRRGIFLLAVSSSCPAISNPRHSTTLHHPHLDDCSCDSLLSTPFLVRLRTAIACAFYQPFKTK